jgi:SAM-dependent methyltransferase
MSHLAPAPDPAQVLGAAETALCPMCHELLDQPPMLRGRDRMLGVDGEFSVVRCAACGLASTVPRLRPEQFAEYYPDTDYHAYRPSEHATATGVRKLRGLHDRLRLWAIVHLGPYRPIGKRRPGRLLDVGCGTGELALTFGRSGWKLSGVEPSAEGCRHAAAAGLEMHHGTLDDAPWSGPNFDAIVFNHSMEHVPDPVATVSQAARLLRPGGILGIGVPNFGCWQRRLFGTRWYQLDLPRHVQHFDERSLTSLVEQAGLRVVAVRTSSMRPSILLSLEYALWGRPRFTGRGFKLAAWAIAPLLLMFDVAGAGDCIHVFAVRDGEAVGER